jgi:hypothetical protein
MLISALVYPVYPRSEDGKARCRSNTTPMIYFDLQPTLRLRFRLRPIAGHAASAFNAALLLATFR